MEWELRSDAPIYAQLVDGVTLKIVSGGFAPGERLPSVRDLAVEAGVNPNTMQRALTELERTGLVYSQRTSGRFVTEDKNMIDGARKHLAEENIRGFLDAMSRLGYMRGEILELLKAKMEEGDGHAAI